MSHRRVVLYIAQGLDGMIAGPDGGVGWLSAYQAEDYGYAGSSPRSIP